MPVIPQINNPVGNKNLSTANNNNNNRGTMGEQFSVEQSSKPIQVNPDMESSSQGPEFSMGRKELAPQTISVPQDPIMAVDTLKELINDELLSSSQINGYTELYGELENLIKNLYISASDLISEILKQENQNTSFSGNKLYDILRSIIQNGSQETKENVGNLLKAINFSQNKNEILNALSANMKFLSDYFSPNPALSQKLNFLSNEWGGTDSAKNFEGLKQETLDILKEVSESLLNDERTQTLLPLIKHTISRYNTNSFMLKEAFIQVMSQIPSNETRGEMAKAFGDVLQNILTPREFEALNINLNITNYNSDSVAEPAQGSLTQAAPANQQAQASDNPNIFINPSTGEAVVPIFVSRETGEAMLAVLVNIETGENIPKDFINTQTSLPFPQTAIDPQTGGTVISSFTNPQTGAMLEATFINPETGEMVPVTFVNAQTGEPVEINTINKTPESENRQFLTGVKSEISEFFKTRLNNPDYLNKLNLEEFNPEDFVKSYLLGKENGKETIKNILNVFIQEPVVTETLSREIDGQDSITALIDYLNGVLAEMPQIPQRETVFSALVEIVEKMNENSELKAASDLKQGAETQSERSTLDSLTDFIEKNINHTAIRSMESFNAQNLLQSLLNAPGVFTPLAHYILPLQIEDTRAFGELWVDNDDNEKSGGKSSNEKKYHLFLTFDVEAIGRFEVNVYASGKKLNISLLHPLSFNEKVQPLVKKINQMVAGTGYTPEKFEVGVLKEPRTLSQVFPRILEGRSGLNVQA